jgi:hypothetical protein
MGCSGVITWEDIPEDGCGFLGLGAKYVSVPFSALRVTEKEGKRYLVIDATKETLTSAPGYQYDTATGKWVPEAKTP